MNLITPDLQDAIFKVFVRLEKHGCVPPWPDDVEQAREFQLDACAVMADNGVTPADIAAAYGALMALECIRFRRWPSNRELLDAVNSRRPHASDTAVKAEASAIFQAIVKEVSSGRHRDLDARVRATFGLAAAEALAAIGGGERINSAGADFLGAVWTAFQGAYVGAVAGGRERADPMKALPAPKPLQLTGTAAAVLDDGPKRISGNLRDLLNPNLDQTLRDGALRAVPCVDPEARLAQLRRQAAELLSEARS